MVDSLAVEKDSCYVSIKKFVPNTEKRIWQEKGLLYGSLFGLKDCLILVLVLN